MHTAPPHRQNRRRHDISPEMQTVIVVQPHVSVVNDVFSANPPLRLAAPSSATRLLSRLRDKRRIYTRGLRPQQTLGPNNVKSNYGDHFHAIRRRCDPWLP